MNVASCFGKLPYRRMMLIIASVLVLGSLSPLVRAEDNAPAAVERTADDEHADQMAQEVFQGSDYWWKRTSNVESSSMLRNFFKAIYTYLIEPVLKWLWDAFVWIMKTLFGRLEPFVGDWSRGIPFTWALVVILVLFGAWQLYRFFKTSPRVQTTQFTSDKLDVLPRAEQLLERARTALADGDHRTAIRFAFLSLIAWYQDLGRLKYDPARCNREYERDLRSWPEAMTNFRAASGPFERCWYGGRDLDAVQVENVIALCTREFQTPEQKGNP